MPRNRAVGACPHGGATTAGNRPEKGPAGNSSATTAVQPSV